MEIAEFLLARYAAEEALARRASDVDWDAEALTVEDFAFASEWSPARVIAECEAKRRIVKWVSGAQSHAAAGDAQAFHDEEAAALTFALRALALPYSDHPDFDPEWKV